MFSGRALGALFSIVVIAFGLCVVAACQPVPTAHCTSVLSGDGQALGPYAYAPSNTDPNTGATYGSEGLGITMSNGSNTYDDNNAFGAQTGTTQTICDAVTGKSPDPSNINVTANAQNEGGNCNNGVQSYPQIQQLTQDYNPTTGTWGGSGSADTPVSRLTSLTSSYSLAQGDVTNNPLNVWEAGWDLWPGTNHGTSGETDAMIWPYESPARGTGGSVEVAANLTLNGSTWDLRRFGTEYIFISATNFQSLSNYNLLSFVAILKYLGVWSSDVTISQIDWGQEICATNGSQQFQTTGYNLLATSS